LEHKAQAVSGAVSLFGDIQTAGNTTHIGGDRLLFALFGGGMAFRAVGCRFSAQQKDDIGILFY
jgi:hypothetical protein